MYAGSPLESKALGIILVLKLAASLLEYGQNTVDAELMVQKVSHSLGLPSPHLNLGARSAQISFGGGPAHLLNCKMDLLVDKLMDVSALCKHIALNEDVVASEAMMVLD